MKMKHIKKMALLLRRERERETYKKHVEFQKMTIIVIEMKIPWLQSAVFYSFNFKSKHKKKTNYIIIVFNNLKITCKLRKKIELIENKKQQKMY